MGTEKIVSKLSFNGVKARGCSEKTLSTVFGCARLQGENVPISFKAVRNWKNSHLHFLKDPAILLSVAQRSGESEKESLVT